MPRKISKVFIKFPQFSDQSVMPADLNSRISFIYGSVLNISRMKLSGNGLSFITDAHAVINYLFVESRMEKSPLLGNGYNPPPTHLNPMQFMALNHAAQQAAHAALLGGSPGSAMQGGLSAGLVNHHLAQSQASSVANLSAHNTAVAHGLISRTEAADAANKGSSSVESMVAAR